MNKEKAMALVEDVPCTSDAPNVFVKNMYEIVNEKKTHIDVMYKKKADETLWEYVGWKFHQS